MKEEGEARRWQFGIAHLLCVMTWASVAAALVAAYWAGHFDDVGGAATGVAQLLRVVQEPADGPAAGGGVVFGVGIVPVVNVASEHASCFWHQ